MELLSNLNELIAGGAFLVSVILALVTWFGKMGVKGKWQLVTSMVTGLVIGILYALALDGVPADYSGWFLISLYGLILGLTASGVYEVGKHIARQ